MVILHIAYIDNGVLGGVQTAVPKMVEAQSQYASVALLNLHGSDVPSVKNVTLGDVFPNSLEKPFDEPDLVVFHELYRVPFIRLYRELKRRKIPYVIVPHGCLSKQAQKQKALKKFVGNTLFFHAFLRSANMIQYLSDNEKAMSKFSLPSYVAGNGVDIPKVRSQGSQEDGSHFVYIGRLDIEIKGLDLLLEAIANSQEWLRAQNVRVSLYGPNTDDSHAVLNSICQEKNISDLVSISGTVLGEEKRTILLGADYFIQTSRSEGMPMGVLEALSYGIPCVVTQGTGMAQIIEEWDAGMSCPTSSEGIGQAIRQTVESFDLRNVQSIHAAELAAEKFDRNKIAKETLEILKNQIQ